MNVLVTGGAGYIGTELIKRLSENSQIEKITIYDNLSKGNYAIFTSHKFPNHQNIKLIQGELLDSRTLKKALDGIDIVYHLAAKVTTPYSDIDPHFFEQTNHWGTAELVYAIEESNVKHLVFASSIGVYGSSSINIDEETVANPRTFYAISKFRGEEHVRRLQDKITTHIIRCGNVYGYSRSMRFDSVINKFVFESNFNNQISIHGNGKQSRAFIHIDTISEVFNSLLDSKAPSGTYNLVEQNLTVLDIVDTLKTLNPALEFIFINQHLSLKSIMVSDDLRLYEYLKKENRPSFEDNIKSLIDRFSF
ncbi:MAG: NAD-dependent epimerase/dehydratase family protein [Bacteroidota bacterium]